MSFGNSRERERVGERENSPVAHQTRLNLLYFRVATGNNGWEKRWNYEIQIELICLHCSQEGSDQTLSRSF